jgi:hypothetical protein
MLGERHAAPSCQFEACAADSIDGIPLVLEMKSLKESFRFVIVCAQGDSSGSILQLPVVVFLASPGCSILKSERFLFSSIDNDSRKITVAEAMPWHGAVIYDGNIPIQF